MAAGDVEFNGLLCPCKPLSWAAFAAHIRAKQVPEGFALPEGELTVLELCLKHGGEFQDAAKQSAAFTAWPPERRKAVYDYRAVCLGSPSALGTRAPLGRLYTANGSRSAGLQAVEQRRLFYA